MASAVHEGRRRHQAGPAVDGRLHDLVQGLPFPAGAEAASPHGSHEDVGLSPQHTLGHAGGPAGVEDVEVVGTAIDDGALGTGGGESSLIPLGARQEGGSRPIVHLKQHVERLQVGEHLGQIVGEGGVEHDAPGPRVVEQVPQLLGHVAVVDVEGCDAGLVGAEHRFDVLVAVVEVAGEVVLSALVAAEAGTG